MVLTLCYKEFDMNEVKTVISVLKVMGYEPVLNEEKRSVSFTSHGFENFKEKHKNIVRAILGSKLNEFFYGHSTQYIYYRNSL